jgi:hypothetical protein
MPNMSYCRFRNTLNDLRDCENNFSNISSTEELRAAKEMLKLCQDIVDSVSIDELELSEEEVEDDY